MKKLFYILALLFPFVLSAQYNPEYFRIGNVQQSWSTQNGSLDSVKFEIKPKGLYAEVGMYFDISTRGTSYVVGDSLEIQMLFKLPQKVEVTDMWLWINDSIIRADVFDKWTASQIYEEIVDRRTDPAILYKYFYYDYYGSISYDNLYMFRIFPLLTNMPRKAKITYLVPINNLNTLNPSISLPANILKLSNQPIQSVQINYYQSQEFLTPKIREDNSLAFTTQTDTSGAQFLGTVLTNTNMNCLTLDLQCNTSTDSRIGTYNDVLAGEKFYQMQIIPNNLFGIKKPKKALILFDFLDSNCQTLDGNDVLTGLQSMIRSNFQFYDSLNIMFSGIVTQSMSNQWIPADSASITNLFNSISTSNFNTYSNLPTLLVDGIQFIKSNGNDGTIVLIASSNSNGTNSLANSIMDDVMIAMDTTNIPIHIIDLDDVNTYLESYYIGGQTYYGNEYLYVNLSMLSGGEYLSIQNTQYNDMLAEVFSKLAGYFVSFDLYTTLESGYTYSNYRLRNTTGLTFFDFPMQQVGKYYGSGRFHLIASAQSNDGQVYQSDMYINLADIDTFDYATRAIWAGQYIREMTSYSQSNMVINQIINTSINERVLSDYTAFLALEPGLGLLDDENGSPSEIEEDTNPDSFSFMNYPNPFNEKTTISFNLNASSKVRIEIYNIYGMLISVLVDEGMIEGKHEIVFNTLDIPAGNYLCRLLIDNEKASTIKLTVIK